MYDPEYKTYIPPFRLPCGHTAYFDVESGCSHRCSACFAVVGSIGMPKSCKELLDMERVVEKLKDNNGQRNSN